VWISLHYSCWIYLITSLCRACTHSLPLSLPALLSSCLLSPTPANPQFFIYLRVGRNALATPYSCSVGNVFVSFISAVYFTIDTALPRFLYSPLFLACKYETNLWRWIDERLGFSASMLRWFVVFDRFACWCKEAQGCHGLWLCAPTHG
jgi:hypothetical protein